MGVMRIRAPLLWEASDFKAALFYSGWRWGFYVGFVERASACVTDIEWLRFYPFCIESGYLFVD